MTKIDGRGMRVENHVVRVLDWEQYGWLRHGFSTRAGGVSTVYGGHDLNLGYTVEDSAEAVGDNRRRFAEAVCGIEGLPVVAVRQIHGTKIEVVAAGDWRWGTDGVRAKVEADGLITSAEGILLGIQVADCVPVLVVDTRRRVVAAFHAGWRGTVSGIVQMGVAQLRSQFGSKPEDLVGAVGPAIGACCYTVGDEVWERFHTVYPYAEELFSQRDTGLHLDLAKANQRQLFDAGLKPDAITVIGDCTACSRLNDGSRKYFSHRAESGFTGRAMGMIGIV